MQTRKHHGLRTGCSALIGALAIQGCLPTVNASSREVSGATKSAWILERPGKAPIVGSWQEDAGQVIGTLSWTKGCVLEETRVIKTETVTEARPNKSGNIGWLIVGAGSTLGGLFAAKEAEDASETVFCGDHQEGDRCSSEKGALTEAAAILIVSGLVTSVFAVARLQQKPKTTVTPVSERSATTLGQEAVACGDVSSLSGLKVALSVPGGGRWLGIADAKGEVKIELGRNLELPDGATFPIEVDDVPEQLEKFVHRGEMVGEVTLSSTTLEEPAPAPRSQRRRKLERNVAAIDVGY